MTRSPPAFPSGRYRTVRGTVSRDEQTLRFSPNKLRVSLNKVKKPPGGCSFRKVPVRYHLIGQNITQKYLPDRTICISGKYLVPHSLKSTGTSLINTYLKSRYLIGICISEKYTSLVNTVTTWNFIEGVSEKFVYRWKIVFRRRYIIIYRYQNMGKIHLNIMCFSPFKRMWRRSGLCRSWRTRRCRWRWTSVRSPTPPPYRRYEN